MQLTMDHRSRSMEYTQDCDSVNNDQDFNGNTADTKSEERDSGTGLSSHSTSADPMSMDDSDEPASIGEELNSSSYHLDMDGELVPINKDELQDTCSDCEASRTYTVPTPVSFINNNANELVDPLQEINQVNIKEKKYPVLPSISKKSCTPRSLPSETSLDNELLEKCLVRELTKNQMDFSRERMEKEADFFADHRINTSKVKATPRTNPLPPIRPANASSPDKMGT
ncbi:uncharacterized protein LOC134271168 [Saccostrea cucullata]|uniref:uncharacterized protein LOC134252459 n=1 Tax=Saccostrea cuccullata TaxID=36930 RepID=UPI002ED2D4CE